MSIKIFTTGGTIDKVYFDQSSEFQVGESPISELLGEANVTVDYSIESILKKDSLDINDLDRKRIKEKVKQCPWTQVLITHGTDTMPLTAECLQNIQGKTIVLTGAMQPARLRFTDAIFNVGYALAAAQLLPSGVYIAMNGRVFEAGKVTKNKEQNRFEDLP